MEIRRLLSVIFILLALLDITSDLRAENARDQKECISSKSFVSEYEAFESDSREGGKLLASRDVFFLSNVYLSFATGSWSLPQYEYYRQARLVRNSSDRLFIDFGALII